MSEMEIGFGSPEEWIAFRSKHPMFMDKLPNLLDSFKKVFGVL